MEEVSYTAWGRKAVIATTTCILLRWMFCGSIKFFLQFVSEGSVENKYALT